MQKESLVQTKIFMTDTKEQTQIQQQRDQLRNYVDNLNSKIDYAKWKQKLVLQYNYLPMKRITQKVENQKIGYLKKIRQEEKNCQQLLSGKEITTQLELFRDFSKKLNEKLQQYQILISEQKLKNNLLVQQVNDKRSRLKQKMRQNMNTIRQNLPKEGIHNKEDMMTLVRSYSVKDKLYPSSYVIDSQRNMTQRKMSHRKISSSSYHNRKEVLSVNMLLFRQCLQKLVQSIQAMKSSQDIQSGIYLDVMDRSVNKKSIASQHHYSKSKISETLQKRFGSGYLHQIRNNNQKNNFEMDWETFSQLNWKQIMGIIMVKDKGCHKLSNLLRYR